jgi:hypothetical protein
VLKSWKVISNTGKRAVLDCDGLLIPLDKPKDTVLRRIFLGFRAGQTLDEGVIDKFGELIRP